MKNKPIDSLFTKRYFTRDCAGCQFWEHGYCNMVSNCSTFQDLFAGGKFYSALTVAKSVTVDSDIPGCFKDGYYIDKDGFRISKVDEDGFYTLMEIVNMPDVAGILVPCESLTDI